jgi:hypothetical protein
MQCDGEPAPAPAAWRQTEEYWFDVLRAAERMVQLTTLPAPESDALCDWEHGVSLCPGCAGVVRLVPHAGQMPRVVDADGREHRCQRQIAAVLHAHGLRGMEPILAKHAERPIVSNPEPPPGDRAPLRGTGL